MSPSLAAIVAYDTAHAEVVEAHLVCKYREELSVCVSVCLSVCPSRAYTSRWGGAGWGSNHFQNVNKVNKYYNGPFSIQKVVWRRHINNKKAGVVCPIDLIVPKAYF